MSDTTERDAVRAEFYARHAQAKTLSAVRSLVVADMADEIVRLRQRLDRAERILAALREFGWPTHQNIIRAAVAAAEREVGG